MKDQNPEALMALLDSIIERKVNAAVPSEVKRQLDAREVPPQFLTRQQVCDSLGCSLPHLHNLMRSGRLPFVKIGRSTRIPLDEFEKAMKSGELKKYARR